MTDEFYLNVENDTEYRGARTVDSDVFSSLSCWTTGPFGVCVESWQDNRLRIGFYISGIKMATVTLTANDPCHLLEEGDFIRVKAETCIDFGRKHVVTEGYVRVAGIRVNFRQVVFSW